MEEYATQTWDRLLERIRDDIGEQDYRSWFAQTTCIGCENNKLIVEVPNQFVHNCLRSRYFPIMKDLLTEISGEPMDVDVRIVGWQQKIATVEPDKSAPSRRSALPPSWAMAAMLNQRYIFENFVVGRSNNLACAAAQAVADHPSQTHNPLFIYGGTGLGKTHLLQAIGHRIRDQRPELKMVYTSAEQFMNAFIIAVQYNARQEFQAVARSIDVLLIDDIQCLAGRERTQEEFFHTFNTLHNAGKQIVISSDRPTKELATLEGRLRSRFEWGLIADIQQPDFETRMSILHKKADLDGIDVPNGVIAFVAENFIDNIRELEGALNRLVASALIEGAEINTQLAEKVLGPHVTGREPRPVEIATIQRVVAAYYGVKLNDLLGKKRSKSIVFPRQVAMYIAKQVTSASYPDIGLHFGNRDHTTVMHSCSKIVRCMTQDPQLKRAMEHLIHDVQRNSQAP